MKRCERIGQSADVQIAIGETGMLQAFFHCDDGVTRPIVRRVRSERAGRFIVNVYPPDPLDDDVESIDAEPAIFVVDVLP